LADNGFDPTAVGARTARLVTDCASVSQLPLQLADVQHPNDSLLWPKALKLPHAVLFVRREEGHGRAPLVFGEEI
jgi:hypothetical protein